MPEKKKKSKKHKSPETEEPAISPQESQPEQVEPKKKKKSKKRSKGESADTISEEILATVEATRDESEEPVEKKKKKKAKKRKNDEESAEVEDSVDQDVVEEETTSESPKKKRKKKKKVESVEPTGESVTFAFGKLPRFLNDDKFKKWLSSRVAAIQINGIRAIWTKSHPNAFVDIDSAFKDQVLALYGTTFNGASIEVEIDEKGPMKNPRTGGVKSPEKDRRTLFVRGIPYDAVEDDVSSLDIFSTATAVRIVKDTETQKSRGFGFVEFADEDSLEDVYQQRFQAKLNGKDLFLDKCSERREKHGNDDSRGRGGGGRGRGAPRGGSRGSDFSRGGGGFRGSRGGGSRGAPRGRGGPRGPARTADSVFQKNKGSIQAFQGKKQTFDSDSD